MNRAMIEIAVALVMSAASPALAFFPGAPDDSARQNFLLQHARRELVPMRPAVAYDY